MATVADLKAGLLEVLSAEKLKAMLECLYHDACAGEAYSSSASRELRAWVEMSQKAQPVQEGLVDSTDGLPIDLSKWTLEMRQQLDHSSDLQ
jgi:hypothetical protein